MVRATTALRVEVQSDGDGALEVRWDLDGTGAARGVGVEIAVGRTPDPAQHDHVDSVAPDGERSIRITGLPPGRHYVSLTPTGDGRPLVAAERWLPFQGVVNFRDLGGYPTADGRHTRWGRVFRSDALHRLTAADLQAFADLGVQAVYDLRRDDERADSPNPVDSVQLSVVSRNRAETWDETVDERRLLQQASDAERALHEAYVGMLSISGPVFGRLLTSIADDRGLPAVFHCAGGKDRTGMSAALLLTWLGVDRETVLDDYELTGQWRRRERAGRTPADALEFYERLIADGVGPEAAEALMGAPRWAMGDALAVLDEDYGGIEAYLRGPAGISRATLDRLRTHLVA